MLKRGQSEIVGLLMIVILLVVIGLIYLRFSLSKQPSGYSDVRSSIEANNLLKAVMKLTVNETSVPDLVEECYQTPSSCVHLGNELALAIASNIKPQEDFKLVIKADDKEILRQGTCEVGMAGSYITVREGVIFESKLFICSK